ncbi:Uncharacterised protein [uncultured archaeon]|nr:Uncharacterised protein [uncultured archaeon]
MEQNFLRVRLGRVVINGKANSEHLYDLCKKEKPPCIAIGWGEIDLSNSLDKIKRDCLKEYEKPLERKELSEIKYWIAMNKGDGVIAMRSPATICAVGDIISKRCYWKPDEKKFALILVGGRPYNEKNPYGEVLFYNRIDVKWITSPDKCAKVRSLGLPKSLENKLCLPHAILRITSKEFNLVKHAMKSYVPKEDESPSKYSREYDNYGKSGR